MKRDIVVFILAVTVGAEAATSAAVAPRPAIPYATIIPAPQEMRATGGEYWARKNVVGGECCNWTSHTWNRFDMEWKLWPRGFAMAEVLWTYPDPAKRDFKEFEKRAAEYRRRLIRSHVNCARVK